MQPIAGDSGRSWREGSGTFSVNLRGHFPTPAPQGGEHRVAVSLHFVYTEAMASEDTTTVRVRRPDSERLQSIAKTRKTTVIDVLHEAIDALERQEFLRGLSDDYRRLREDPPKWQTFIEERQEWDSIG